MQEKTLTGGRSYYLDIARAIAIISISLNHAVNRTYLVDYDFPLLLLCAMGLLELLRRGAEHLRGLRPVVTYLAKISFGVYFIYILIMSLLEWNMNFDGWIRPLKLLFLEGVSVGGSILLIALFSGIPFCRRRMFGIKG